jgi:hypothetical protein
VTDGSCTHFCLPGWTDNAANSVVHTCPSGTFAGTPLSCVEAYCPNINIPNSDYAITTLFEYFTDETEIVTCDDGGEFTVTCVADTIGTSDWSGVPTCAASGAAALEAPPTFTVEVTLTFEGLTIADINDETVMEDIIASSLPPAAGEIVQILDSEAGLVVITEFSFDDQAEALSFSEEAPNYSVSYLNQEASIIAAEPVHIYIIDSAPFMSVSMGAAFVLALSF